MPDVSVQEDVQKEKEPVVEPQPSTSSVASGSISLEQVLAKWAAVVEKSRAHNHSVSAFLRMVRPVEMAGNRVVLGCKFAFHKARLEDLKHRQIIEAVFDEVFQIKLVVECIIKPDLVVADASKGRNVTPISGADTKKDGEFLDQVMNVFGGELVRE
jgi:hypothetical protein